MSAHVPTTRGKWWRKVGGVTREVVVLGPDERLVWSRLGSLFMANPVVDDGMWLCPVPTYEQVAALVAAGDEAAMVCATVALDAKTAIAWERAVAPFRVPS